MNLFRMSMLEEMSHNLSITLSENRADKLDELEALFQQEGMNNTLVFVRKLLRQGEDKWALGIYISEQDKIINRHTSAVHAWFVRMCKL